MKFKSKHHAMNMRLHAWGCVMCPADYRKKTDTCMVCGSPVVYFTSQPELKRYRQLQLMEKAKRITNIELQPVFPIIVNGKKIREYRADFRYLAINGDEVNQVIEDVKGTTNEKYLDPVFKIKRDLVEAIYGIKIKIVKP